MSISISNVSFAYSTSQPVLRSLDLSISDGECVLLIGQNGAGKSTLLKLLNGILKPTEGTVTVNSRDTAHTPTAGLAAHIAVTFQNPADQIFASSVRAEVRFGPKTLGRPDHERLTDFALGLFHLRECADRHPYDLPLAQRKLVTLASAVATDAPILAFDEPSASLGQTERPILRAAFDTVRRHNRTLLVVSHDFDLFLAQTTKLVALGDSRFIHVATASDLVDDPRIAAQSRVQRSIPLRLQKIVTALHQQR